MLDKHLSDLRSSAQLQRFKGILVFSDYFLKNAPSQNCLDGDPVCFLKDNIHNKYNIYYIYYVGFVICEFLNLIVVICTIWMTNKFLNGQFMWYGFRVWTYYRLVTNFRSLSNDCISVSNL